MLFLVIVYKITLFPSHSHPQSCATNPWTSCFFWMEAPILEHQSLRKWKTLSRHLLEVLWLVCICLSAQTQKDVLYSFTCSFSVEVFQFLILLIPIPQNTDCSMFIYWCMWDGWHCVSCTYMKESWAQGAVQDIVWVVPSPFACQGLIHRILCFPSSI